MGELVKEVLLTIGAGLLVVVAAAVFVGTLILAFNYEVARWALGVPLGLGALWYMGAEVRWEMRRLDATFDALAAIWNHERKAKRERQWWEEVNRE